MKIKKTKIISTIGPSSSDNKIIAKLIKKGMDVARINMAHIHLEKDFKNLVSKIRYLVFALFSRFHHNMGECFQIENVIPLN